MKILVIQLARLGDIFQGWPALRALKRTHPEAEVHVLVRPRFQAALTGLEGISKVHVLPTAEILQSYFNGGAEATVDCLFTPRDEIALASLQNFLTSLEGESFDWLVNMSFSPLSADLTSWLSGPETKVTGYTRFNDGHLHLPDAMSAYFFAQVGFDRGNRFHLAEIFGTLCEVDLLPEDWKAPVLPAKPQDLSSDYLAVHIGGSESHKSLSVSKWISILRHLRSLRPFRFALVGGAEDRDKGEQLRSVAPDGEVINFAGDLSLSETMSVIAGARLLIGPDSAPLHMASLTATPTLNLSLGRVSYWETGPRAPGSVVLRAESEEDLLSSVIGDRVVEMVHGMRHPLGTIESQPGTPSFAGASTPEEDFQWNLILAIYQGASFPAPVDDLFVEGVQQMRDANLFMIEQMRAIQTVGDLRNRNEFLKRGEEVIETIAKLVPSLAPLVRWYQTEKVRIGPQSLDQILAKNLETQNLLQAVLDLYAPAYEPEPQTEKEHL